MEDVAVARIAVDGRHAAHAADVLKALSHPLRLRIVALLSQGELQVNALAERLGKPAAIISQQLRILRMTHLVDAERHDGGARYFLTEPRLVSLLRCVAGCPLPARDDEPGSDRP